MAEGFGYDAKKRCSHSNSQWWASFRKLKEYFIEEWAQWLKNWNQKGRRNQWKPKRASWQNRQRKATNRAEERWA